MGIDLTIKKPRQHVGLCTNCDNAHVVTDRRGRDIVFCDEMAYDTPIVGGITECNRFEPYGFMTQYEAKQMGWVLENRPGKKIGFSPPKKNDRD